MATREMKVRALTQQLPGTVDRPSPLRRRPALVRPSGTGFRISGVLLGLLLLPGTAEANMGTLFLASSIHMAIGNLLIGLLEGLLLVWFFQVPWRKAVLVMIAANYASTWLGGIILRQEILGVLPLNLGNAWRWFWILVVVTWVLTLLIEWPFVGFALRGTKGWLRRSIQASLLVQCVSYVLLFGYYWSSSGTSLYTQNRIVAPDALSLPESVLVYFIDPEHGHVHRRPLGGGPAELVFELGSTNYWDRLCARPNASNSNHWDVLVAKGPRSKAFMEVLTNQPVIAVADTPRDQPTLFHMGPPGFVFRAPALGGATNSPWCFYTGGPPSLGLRGEHAGSGERRGFAYETLFGTWRVRSAFLLPGDLVLFQLGADQICAYDHANAREALLWRGSGPLPVIELPEP
jgi:hypothetical protein